MRWIAVLSLFGITATGAAQTALRTNNFIFYSNNSTNRQAELGLSRLEDLRAAIQAIHGSDWAPKEPLRIWVPRNGAEWRSIALNASEQGIFLSGARSDWIVVNPAAQEFLEVLSHEYIHAVLHRAIPNLPTWFEEGVCEYYSSVALRAKGGQIEIVLGKPPGHHLSQLSEISSIRLSSLTTGLPTPAAYAMAWAAAYQLWPTYRPGQIFPDAVPVGPFAPRTIKLPYTAPDKTLHALSPEEMSEIEIEFRQRLPTAAGVPVPPAAKAEALLLEGLRLSDAGQHLKAVPLLEEACRLRPSNSSWWHSLALAAKEAGQINTARTAVQRALATATNFAERTAAEVLEKSLPTLR